MLRNAAAIRCRIVRRLGAARGSRFCVVASAVLAVATLVFPVGAGAQPAAGRNTPAATKPAQPSTSQGSDSGALAAGAAPSKNASAPAPASVDETVVTPGLALTPEALTARAEWLRASADFPPDVRERALSSYDTALHNLTTAQSLERKAQAFEQARVDAPRTLAELTRELGRPATEPDADRGLPLAELEGTLRAVQADLVAARTTLASIEGEQNKRSRRRLEAPQQIAEARADLAEVESRLRALPPSDSDEAVVAERAALLSRQAVLDASLRVYDRELASYDARGDLLSAKRDQALRRVARLSERATDLEDRLGTARARAAERDANNALAAQRDIALVHPLLGRVAERNAKLATLRSGPNGLNNSMQQVSVTLADTRTTLDQVHARFSAARDKAAAVGFTPAIGLLLRKERAELPALTERRRSMRERRTEIGAVQLRLIELEEERDGLADLESAVRRIMADVEKVWAPSRLRVVESTARELLLTQRGYLDTLIKDYDRYFTSLVDLDGREGDLVTAVRKFSDYIDENVLWIRGPSIVNTRTADGVQAAVAWVSRPSHVERLLEGCRATLAQRSAPVLILLAVWGVLWAYRFRAHAMLAELCSGRAKVIAMSTARTAEAIVLTAVLASPWPLLLVLVSLVIDSVEGASGELGAALAGGLVDVAKVAFVGDFLRRMCKAGGVFETHFGLPRVRARALRRGVASAMVVGLPALLAISTLNGQTNELFKFSLGRIAFAIAMTWVALAAFRALHPKAGVLEGLRARRDSPWYEQALRLVHLLAASVPLALVIMAASGYDFAAQSITRRLGQTAAFGLLLYVANALVTRWLVVARRRLALRQAWERQAAQQQAEESRETDGEMAIVTEADTLDIGAVNAQTRRLLRTVTILSVVIGFWLVWHDVLPALRVLEHVDLWHVSEQVTETVSSEGGPQQRTFTQQRAITILDVLTALVIATVALAAGRNLPGFLEMTVLQRLPFDAGLRYAVTTISRYLIAVIGSVLAVNALGLGWSQVQWLVAAMTVGLGFGLQEIFANFIAGIIMLFERPVRVGDVVTLGNLSGTVARIRIRATTIVDWDRKEIIIPNKEFITGQLINWTLSDQILRVVIPVGIAYGSDTQLAERLLLQVAERCEYVLADPPPTVMFSAFGESALDFQLRVHIAQFDHMWRARHALCMAIDKEFRKAGIEISFPQRDLHIRSIAGPIEVAMHTSGEPRTLEAEPRAGRR